MIGDLNDTLKQYFIERIPLDPREVEIAFEAPDSEWSNSVVAPTINCYLYHIQENHQLRVTQWEQLPPQPGARAGVRRRPPFRIELHYQITIWATEVEDEHRLLWRVLGVLLREDKLPPAVLKGALAGSEWPIPISVAQPESLLKNPSDFWTTFEHHIKPGVGCMITLPLDPEQEITSPLVLTRHVRMRPPGGGPPERSLYSMGGYVRATRDDQRAVPGVPVRLVERNIVDETDVYGRYLFERLPAGRYTLEAELEGRVVRQEIALPGAPQDLLLDGPT